LVLQKYVSLKTILVMVVLNGLIRARTIAEGAMIG